MSKKQSRWGGGKGYFGIRDLVLLSGDFLDMYPCFGIWDAGFDTFSDETSGFDKRVVLRFCDLMKMVVWDFGIWSF